MYPVTVFCKEADYETFVRACAPHLPEEVLTASAQTLSKMDIAFAWNTDPLPGLRNIRENLICSAPPMTRHKAYSRNCLWMKR